MDSPTSPSASPYRVAWQPPDAVRVRASSREAVLEALELRHPLSRRALQAMTCLSPLTLRRTCRQLVREGGAILQYGRDPETGRACDLMAPADYPVLPILEVSPAAWSGGCVPQEADPSLPRYGTTGIPHRFR